MGRVGGTIGTISGPFTTILTEVMSSSRNLNTNENTGVLPRGTNWLAHCVQRKFDKFVRWKDPVIIKKDAPHLLKNRGKLGGYFDYKAYREDRLRQASAEAPKPQATAKAVGPDIARADHEAAFAGAPWP
jgi:hypothetical protein